VIATALLLLLSLALMAYLFFAMLHPEKF